jgi:hypothetical protein
MLKSFSPEITTGWRPLPSSAAPLALKLRRVRDVVPSPFSTEHRDRLRDQHPSFFCTYVANPSSCHKLRLLSGVVAVSFGFDVERPVVVVAVTKNFTGRLLTPAVLAAAVYGGREHDIRIDYVTQALPATRCTKERGKILGMRGRRGLS